jgi:hypothetical protein
MNMVRISFLAFIAFSSSSAVALDATFSGTWSIVSPPAHVMVGAKLLFSDIKSDSVFVQIDQASGLLLASDGRGGSNHVIRAEGLECYYDIVTLSGGQEMTWRLVNSNESPCLPSFQARRTP